jgi:sulfite exporter TauE/SafE
MGIGTSLVLIAIGAVLRFAISVSAHGFSIHTIGVILMIVGAIGLLISLLWVAMWRDRRPGGARYVERDVPPPADTY